MIYLEQITDLYSQEDGSYVVYLNGVPYHKPNKDEWKEDWETINEFVKAGKVVCKSWEEKDRAEQQEDTPNGSSITIDLSPIAANPYKKYTTQFGTWIESTIPTGEKILEGFGYINMDNYTSLNAQTVSVGRENEKQINGNTFPIIHMLPLPKILKPQASITNIKAINITEEAKASLANSSTNYKDLIPSTERAQYYGTSSISINLVNKNIYTLTQALKDPELATGNKQFGSIMNYLDEYQVESFLTSDMLCFSVFKLEPHLDTSGVADGKNLLTSLPVSDIVKEGFGYLKFECVGLIL